MWVLLCGAIMASLLGVKLTRDAEDAGRVEFLGSLGLGKIAYRKAAALVIIKVSFLWALVISCSLALQVGSFSGFSVEGVLIFAALNGILFSLHSILTILASDFSCPHPKLGWSCSC